MSRPSFSAERLRQPVLAAFAAALPLGVAVQQGVLALLLAVFALSVWQMRRLPRSPLDLPLGALLVALLLSTALCPYPLRSLRAYDRLWMIGALFAVYHLVRTRAEVERLVAVTIGVAAVVAAYGIVQHFTGLDLAKGLFGKRPDVHVSWLGGSGYRTKGLHPSAITYAHNVLFPLTFATVYALAPRTGPGRRAALFVAWLLMVLALVFSLTRGVWLAFVVVLLVLGVVRGGRIAAAAATALLVLIVLLTAVDPGIRARARSAFDLPANVGRTQIWRANLDMARERPFFGWGYGNYKIVRQPFYDRYPEADTTAHAHNNFLQTQVDGGVVALAAFVALFFVMLREGSRGYRAFTPTDEPARSLQLASFLAVIGFLVGGLTQYNFGDAEVVIYLWFTAGLLLRLAALSRSGDEMV